MHSQSTNRRPAAAPIKPTLRRLGVGRYQVGSRTTAGVSYTVTLAPAGSYACSCPARNGCWHGPFAQQASRFYAAWYAQATPAAMDLPGDLPPFPACPALASRPAGLRALDEAFGFAS